MLYYALSDKFAGDNPREYTHGFANTSTAIAFRSRADRDAWLADTRLLKARKLTRAEAYRYARRDSYGTRYIPIYGEEA